MSSCSYQLQNTLRLITGYGCSSLYIVLPDEIKFVLNPIYDVFHFTLESRGVTAGGRLAFACPGPEQASF